MIHRSEKRYMGRRNDTYVIEIMYRSGKWYIGRRNYTRVREMTYRSGNDTWVREMIHRSENETWDWEMTYRSGNDTWVREWYMGQRMIHEYENWYLGQRNRYLGQRNRYWVVTAKKFLCNRFQSSILKMLPRIYFAVSLMSITTFIDGVLGFYCYTGDGEVIRTKLCPSIGENFSDICFKKFGEPLASCWMDLSNIPNAKSSI